MKQIYATRTGQLVATSSTRWQAPFSGNATWSATEQSAKIAQGGYLGYLRVERRAGITGALTAVPAGMTETYQLVVNSVNDASWIGGTVTIAEGQTSGLAPALDVPVQIGDLVSLSRTVVGGTPGTFSPHVSLVFSGSTRLVGQHCGYTAISAAATEYVAPFIMSDAVPTRESDRGSNLVACPGSITYHTAQLNVAPGAGNSVTLALYKNGTKQDGAGGTANTTIAISDSATTGTASFALAVVAGDQLSLEITPASGPSSSALSYGCRFTATDPGGEISAGVPWDNISNFCGSHGSLPASNSAVYHCPNHTVAGTPEAVVSVGITGKALDESPDAGSAFWLDLTSPFQVKAATAPGAGNTRVWTPRINAADTGTAATMADAATTATGNGGTYTSDSVFSIEQAGTSTPAASAWLCYAFYAFVGQNYFTAGGGTITSITPATGPTSGSTAFTIAGTDFPTDADSVIITLRGVAATGVTVNSATEIVGTSAASLTAGVGDVAIAFVYTSATDKAATLLDGWTYTSSDQWFVFDPSTTAVGADTGIPAATPTSNGAIYYYGAAAPGTGWTTTVAPSTNGWWWSDEGMAGAPYIVDDNDNPEPPRAWTEIVSFATGAADHLGGFPGCAVAHRNKLIYAGRDYTVAAGDPPIRIFDGASDRLLTKIPPDSAGAVAVAVMSMLAANGTIYVASLDTGGNGGRVFNLDLASATLTPIGAAFATGEVPYALCFGMGRLWVGTNFGTGAPGRVLYFRPDIDSAWTEDEQFGAALGGVCSLAFYNGALYAGIDNEAATAGAVYVRGTDGAWASSVAGSGTAAMNGFTYLLVFGTNLYASYWDSAASTSLIRKYDGSSWTTVYTGASGTAKPIVGMFLHGGYIYALFGAATDAAALIRSATGASSSYTDLSAYLTVADSIESTSAFASVRF